MTTVNTVLRICASAAASLTVGVAAVWAGFALWYQAPGNAWLKILSVTVWLALSLVTLLALWQGRAALGFLVFALAYAGVWVWWQGLPPSNHRQWSDDVARMTTGAIDGHSVVLDNVRNFDWRTTENYTQRWERRTYDLNQLRSVDMIMSYWAGKAIAHMLVSFGFDEGQQVAFSVEIRRERGEEFSEIGGFFKEFELSIIAADERDVVRLRTNVRGETAYLYRMKMPAAARRLLFLGYVGKANELASQPRFYHSVTDNCTTVVYHMMKRIVGHLPLSYRLLLSGYLPEYVYEVGGFGRRFTLQELREGGRITERARQSDRSATFSADIRRGVPGIETNRAIDTEEAHRAG